MHEDELEAAPLGLYVPAGHVLGAVAPAEQNWPVGHSVHAAEALLDAYVPAGHVIGFGDPSGQY